MEKEVKNTVFWEKIIGYQVEFEASIQGIV
jgi:hypothetical protein